MTDSQADATERTCLSAHHPYSVPAVITGRFDCSAINGRPPQDDYAYCLRCAVILEVGGLFTPARALAPMPNLAEAYADKLHDTWTVTDQQNLLEQEAPDTVTLLRACPDS